MARQKSELEPGTQVSGPSGKQSIENAARRGRVGNGKTAVVFVDVFQNSSTTTVTFDIETASDVQMPSVNGSASNWASANATGTKTIAAGAVGVVIYSIDRLGDVIRWAVSGVSTPNTVAFRVTVFFADT